ncbi:hypothetical protein K435DRAFT_162986 [Dendrothele bispora CBS 962.96]|uniref:Uncharacterized protein n=1 Tax=Dendrothele bispora (strain CBS 962.96) TaxID=1314807 RepID=A0A4S8LXM0_DENBC|nr:hypothetical protein K435DRAFT_162986 [Dendrothele bispora CBS 962.96]
MFYLIKFCLFSVINHPIFFSLIPCPFTLSHPLCLLASFFLSLSSSPAPSNKV